MIGRWTLLCCLALLAAAGLAGCGGSTEVRTVVKTVEVPATTTAETTAESEEPAAEEDEAEPATDADPESCEGKGISPEVGNTGRCVEDGYRFAVVNRGDELRLKSVAVKLDGISFTDSVASDISNSRASGTFAVVALTVRNRSNSPQTFVDGFNDQVVLQIGERQFTEDFDAANGSDQRSFLWQGQELQPGASQSGHLIFDVPKREVRRIAEDGQLTVVDFGVDLSYPDEVPELGIIRLWK